jgi:hypothetical protein
VSGLSDAIGRFEIALARARERGILRQRHRPAVGDDGAQAEPPAPTIESDEDAPQADSLCAKYSFTSPNRGLGIIFSVKAEVCPMQDQCRGDRRRCPLEERGDPPAGSN